MVYVDVKACIENFSRELIRIKLNPPMTPTIFIDLIQFTPGQPDAATSTTKPAPPPLPPTNGNDSQTGRVPIHILPQRPVAPQSSSSSSAPPPPPWSRSESISSGPSSQSNVDPLIPFKRKRKPSIAESGRESVLVFDADSPLPATGSPSTHRGVHHASPTSLNIIMQSPTQMAAAQKEAESKKATNSPTASPLLNLSLQSHSAPNGQHRPLPTMISPYRRPEEVTPHQSPRTQPSIPTVGGSPNQSRPAIAIPITSPRQSRALVQTGSPNQSRISIPIASPRQPRTVPPPLPSSPRLNERTPSLPSVQAAVASVSAPIRKVMLHVRPTTDRS